MQVSEAQGLPCASEWKCSVSKSKLHENLLKGWQGALGKGERHHRSKQKRMLSSLERKLTSTLQSEKMKTPSERLARTTFEG